ncbi:MAG: zf-HC2 domain-containing protein [Acidobacteriota bacterium]
MTAANIDEHEIRRLLLGELQPEERVRIEQEFLLNPAYREEILAIENDLIDDYLDGMLSPEQQEKFKRHLASTPEQRTRIRISRLVKDNLTSGPPSPLFDSDSANDAAPVFDTKFLRFGNPLIYLPIAAIVLIAVLLGAFEVVNVRRINNERSAAESRRLEIERELARLNREWRAHPPSNSRVFFTTLLPIGTRGASASEQLSPPPNTEVFELRLVLTGEVHRTYSAEIQEPALAARFTITDLMIETVEGHKAVVLRLPYTFFKEGEFRVLLRGMTNDDKMEDIGEYVFHIKS